MAAVTNVFVLINQIAWCLKKIVVDILRSSIFCDSDAEFIWIGNLVFFQIITEFVCCFLQSSEHWLQLNTVNEDRIVWTRTHQEIVPLKSIENQFSGNLNDLGKRMFNFGSLTRIWKIYKAANIWFVSVIRNGPFSVNRKSPREGSISTFSFSRILFGNVSKSRKETNPGFSSTKFVLFSNQFFS